MAAPGTTRRWFGGRRRALTSPASSSGGGRPGYSPSGRAAASGQSSNPLDGVAGLRDEPGLLAVLLVLIGGTAFDGLTRSRLWVQAAPADSTVVGTLGLVVMVALVTVLYHRAMVVVRRVSREETSVSVAGLVAAGAPAAEVHRSPLEDDPARVRATAGINLPGWFAPSLVPIAVGYVIAHYFSLLLFEGQQTWLLLGDRSAPAPTPRGPAVRRWTTRCCPRRRSATSRSGPSCSATWSEC